MENCLNIETCIVLRETKCSASLVALATFTSKNTKDTIYKISDHVEQARKEECFFPPDPEQMGCGQKCFHLNLSEGCRAYLHTLAEYIRFLRV